MSEIRLFGQRSRKMDGQLDAREPQNGSCGLASSITHNLEWLADNHGMNRSMPCGMLPGQFLLMVSQRIKDLADRVNQHDL